MEKVFLIVITTWNFPCSSPLSSECISKIEFPTIVQQMPDMDTCIKAGQALSAVAKKSSFTCQSMK